MKLTTRILALVLALFCLPALAQFRNTNGVYQYQGTLQNSDVFVIGRPSANTNYNYASSNLFITMTNVANSVANPSALTNQDTRFVNLKGGLQSTSVTITGAIPSLSLSNASGASGFVLIGGQLYASDSLYVSTNVVAVNGQFIGNGAGLTNIAGASNNGNATNVYAGGSVTTSNVLTQASNRTNANAFMGYGGAQLSTATYGQAPSGNYNYRNGVEFLDNGWNGSPLPPTDGSTVLNGFMRSYWNWGGAADAPVLHIADKGSIRIEANYGDPAYFGEAYVALGNEDGNPKVRINYVSASTTNNGDLGYSLPLTFDARGKISGVNQTAQPGFMGRWAGPAGGAGPYEGLYQGELSFYSRVPVPDTNYPTYGNNFPTSGVEVGRMRTNGWQFFGPVNYQQTSRSLFGTNVVLDFNAGSAQAIALASGITNRFSTVNVDAYAGTTNLEPRFFRITSGGLDTPIIWPAWNAGSENGIAPLPSILPATNALFLRLSGWGTGDTNIIADWRMSPDTAFAYDSDAAAFFTAASITDVYQKGAVDYLVKALKAANEWTNMVALYPFIGGASNQHALNLKNPATYPITFTSSGVTHNGNGITGNGSSGYGSIPIDWATAIPQSVTNFHLAVYNRTTTPTDGGAFIGGRNGSSVGAGLTRESASAGVRGAMNTLGPNAIVNLSTDLTGPLVLTRANNFNNFDVGTRLGVTTTTSDAVTSFSPNPYILAYNFNGSASAYSTANLSFASLGFGFTAAQLTNFMNIVANYNAARSGAALGWAYRYVGTHVGDGSGLTNLPSGGSTTITNTTSAAGVVVGGSGSFGIGTNLTSVAGGTNQFWVAASPPNEKYTNLFGNTDEISGAYRVFTVGTNVGNNVQISDGITSFPNGMWIDAGAQEYFVGKISVGTSRGQFQLGSGAVSNLTATGTIYAPSNNISGGISANFISANTSTSVTFQASQILTGWTNNLVGTDGNGRLHRLDSTNLSGVTFNGTNLTVTASGGSGATLGSLRQSVLLFEEFITKLPTSGAGTGPLGFLFSANSGITAHQAIGGEADAPGIIQLNTSSSATASPMIYSAIDNYQILFGGGNYTNEWRLRLPTLPTAAEGFSNRLGFVQSQSTAVAPDGVYMTYDTNDTHFILVTRKDNTESRATNTTVLAANTWYRVQITVLGTTNAIMTVNDSDPVSITSNIPTTGDLVALFGQMVKVTGTTARSLQLDYCGLAYSLYTSR